MTDPMLQGFLATFLEAECDDIDVSFMEAGYSIAGQEVAPDDLLICLSALLFSIVVVMLTGIMAVDLIEMHLVICGGVILIGFGGLEYTRDIALSYLRYSLPIGAKLPMIMIVYALANALVIDLEANFREIASQS